MNLIIRADASHLVGYGHVMRCLALAHAWKSYRNHVVLVSHQLPQVLRDRFEKDGIAFKEIDVDVSADQVDARQLVQIAQDLSPCIIILDGYHFDAQYQQLVRNHGLKLLVIDDYAHLDCYSADWILNQNPNACVSMYPAGTVTKYLFGSAFALLRREFWHLRERFYACSPTAQKLLVTIGGTDPQNITLKVLHAIGEISTQQLEVTVVVSAVSPHLTLLQEEINWLPHNIRLETNVSDMSSLMTSVDAAISAGGSTLWELALIGVPTCAIITAENQRHNVDALKKHGAILELTLENMVESINRLICDTSIRLNMSHQSRTLVDGYGVERTIMHLKNDRLWLRPAQEQDAKIIWEWANEPVVRTASFNSAPIPWETHLQWFTKKLSDENSHFWLGLSEEDVPIGQVRFDVSDKEATISVMVTTQQANKGYGSKLIDLAVSHLFEITDVNKVLAYIKINNPASIRVFEKAGFNRLSELVIHENPAYLYMRAR